MKILNEPDIRKLRLGGKVSRQDGKKVETVRPPKKERTGPDAEERQATGLESIARILHVLMQTSQGDRSAESMLELAKAMDKRMVVDYPKPVQGWTFSVVRNNKGFIDKIRAKAV